jgi:hypothetical protein
MALTGHPAFIPVPNGRGLRRFLLRGAVAWPQAAVYNPRLSDPRRCFFSEIWAPRSLSIRRLALEQLLWFPYRSICAMFWMLLEAPRNAV